MDEITQKDAEPRLNTDQKVHCQTYEVITTDTNKLRKFFIPFVIYYVVVFLFWLYLPSFNKLFGPLFLLPILLTFAIANFYKKIFDQQVTVELLDRKMIVSDNKPHTFFYDEIRDYKLNYRQPWVKFEIAAENNRKITLAVSTIFTEAKSLESFFKDFNGLMVSRAFENRLSLNRKPSFRDSPAYLILLLVITGLAFFATVDGYYKWNRLPPPQAILWVSPLIAAWYNWYKKRENNQEL